MPVSPSRTSVGSPASACRLHKWKSKYGGLEASELRLIRIFEQLKQSHGLPHVLRTDNDPEFLSEALVNWAKFNGMSLRYIQPGKPNQSAYIERFNRTFREGVLDQHLFTRLDDVREAAYGWMLEYNQARPHDALGHLTPADTSNHLAGSSTF